MFCIGGGRAKHYSRFPKNDPAPEVLFCLRLDVFVFCVSLCVFGSLLFSFCFLGFSCLGVFMLFCFLVLVVFVFDF